MNDEIELTLKSQNRLLFKARLSHFDGMWIREKTNATFSKSKNGMGLISVHRPIVGKYRLDIFAKHFSDEGSFLQVAVYCITCNIVKDSTFEFPMVYSSDHTNQCEIMQPRNARLPVNSEVMFEIRAPHMKAVSINQKMLEGNCGTFRGAIMTKNKGLAYNVNAVFFVGSITQFKGMFQFYTV
ncbi:hypothetical protein DPMN_024103 [Dreissena polymorpha]|uniref:KY-like immunoglobulin-like domain-containing protein n=1 Tax=Dreissena polymorpha TaxID=45954 RepID=A0A9D4LNA1_DREPO|nr:hypothetical protein DPMN_024103 [Dreissena polymorpha]